MMSLDKSKEKNKFSLGSFRELGLVGFIVLISAIVQFLNKEFLTPGNLTDLINNTAILAILAIGMLMVMLTAGIDLSIGSTMALSGMVVAMIVREQFITNKVTINPIIAILMGIGVGIICGGIIGVLVSQLKIVPIIATLGVNYIYRGATNKFSSIGGSTKGPNGGAWVSAHQLPDSFKNLGTGSFLGVSYLVWIAIVIYIIAQYFLSSTRTGRMIYATGSNKEAVVISGISSKKIELLVYTIMGALAGLAGVLWTAKFASAQPDTAGGYEVNVIAACVMGGVSVNGGRGKVIGVLLGSLLIGIINSALPLLTMYISPFWQKFIQGFIILFAILMNVIVKRRNDKRDLERRAI